MKRFLSIVGTLGVMTVGLGASSVMASTPTTTFNVPCGNIALLEQAVGTPGATVNLANHCTYHLVHEFNSPADGFADDELPTITGFLTINGHGSVLLGIPITSSACCGRILEVGPSGTLTLNSVTLSGGRALFTPWGGGGLLVWGKANLSSSVVKGNWAECGCGSSGNAFGGGIDNQGGTLRLKSSSVLANMAPESEGGEGGGIASFGGTVSLSNSRVSGNTVSGNGGGIFESGTTLNLSNSTVTGNRVTANVDSLALGNAPLGGGILAAGGTLTLYQSLVAGNGISNPSGFLCTGCDLNSQGGGIYVGSASVFIDQSQLSNNKAATKDPSVDADGGGLYNDGGSVTFSRSTVKGNAAENNGGGSAGGGGIFNANGGTVTLFSTTVISNLPDNCEPTITGCT